MSQFPHVIQPAAGSGGRFRCSELLEGNVSQRPRHTLRTALLCLAVSPVVTSSASAADEAPGARWQRVAAGQSIERAIPADPTDAYPAGSSPWLADLAGRSGLRLGARNLGTSAASCVVTLRSADGAEIGSSRFAVAAGAVGYADELSADVLAPDAAQVTCDQQFDPVSVARGNADGEQLVAKASGPNGSCQLWTDLARQPDGSYRASLPGLLHQPTKAKPKGIVCVRLASAVDFGTAVFDWDFVAGAWFPKRPTGIHNLAYIFTERYRGGVVANVNAVNKSAIKFMQNYDMPIKENTNRTAQYQLRTNVVYHATYTFDAKTRWATLQLFLDGVEVRKLSQQIFPNGNVLALSPYGKGPLDGLAMVVEFGNYEPANPKEIPEVPTYGWLYGNLVLRMTP
jgi:hypothetical protein